MTEFDFGDKPDGDEAARKSPTKEPTANDREHVARVYDWGGGGGRTDYVYVSPSPPLYRR